MDIQKDRIFISYRRSDTSGSATAIRKTLLERFGEQSIFQDVEGIAPGAEFPATLRDELKRAAVVLAVIGRNWLLAANEYGQRRIDFEDDWVRTELSLALQDPEVTVVPVLVDGADMPPARALPQSLMDLCTRNAVSLRHDAWDDTVRPLLNRIADILKPDQAAPRLEASGLVTPELIRHAVAEALESANHPSGQILLVTVDEISRIIATISEGELECSKKATLEFLLTRLIDRPLVQVAAHLQEVLRYTFYDNTLEGRWLGYALNFERSTYEGDFTGCVLLLPGSASSVMGGVSKVIGAAVIRAVNCDYYGASSNDPPGPYVTASPALVQVGHRYETSP